MQKLELTSTILQKDTLIDQTYQESIIVPKGVTLTIKGQINRLIIINVGTVIVKGVVNRINCFKGTIIIEQNGYGDSLYCGIDSKIINKGKIHQTYILKNTELIMEPNSIAIDIYNNDSKTLIKENSYVKNYNQYGNNAKCNITGEGDRTIQNMNIICGGKNE